MKQLKISKEELINSIEPIPIESIIYSYKCNYKCIDCIFLYDNKYINCGGTTDNFNFLMIKEWLSSCNIENITINDLKLFQVGNIPIENYIYSKEYIETKAKLKRIKYQKQYRLKNKNKRKEYLAKNKDKLKEYHKQWEIKNSIRLKEYYKEYNLKRNDKLAENGISYKELKKKYFSAYYLKNKDKISLKAKQRYLNNKNKIFNK